MVILKKINKWLSSIMIFIFSIVLLPANAFAANTSASDEIDNSGIISGRTYVITSKNSGKAMEVASFGTQNGEQIQQWDYGNGTSQQWIIEKVEGKYYKIVSKNSSKVIDVKDMSTENGATIHQWDDVNGENLLRVKNNGEFISLYHGCNSSRVINAMKKGGVIWQKH